MSSRSNSEIIRMFTSAKHDLELQADTTNLRKALDVIHKRKEKIQAKLARQGIVKVEQKTFNQSINEAEKFKKIDDHRIPIEDFYKRYQTDPIRGLTQNQANIRLLAEGPNKLTEKKKMHWALQFLLHMANFFSILIWIGAGLCFLAYGLQSDDPSNLYLGLVLVSVVLIGNTIQYVQNKKSSDLMQSFKNFQPPEAIVIRDGVEKTVAAERIVRGDIVKIPDGKRIPADIRIIQSNGMKVDNASLTGETQLQSRSAECTSPNNPLESKNIAFFSTLCRDGSGTGVVIFTGDNTFIGQIAGLAASAPDDITPLEKQIDRFVFRLGMFSITLGILIFGIGLAIGFKIIVALTLAIGITVANVPNGLLIEVTIALTLTAKSLAKKKVLAKNLRAVQTLGSTTCICSDKTGTLTLNKMTAANLWYNLKICKAANRQKQGATYKYEYDLNDPCFQMLHECFVICSIAIFDRSAPQLPIQKIREDDSLSEQQKRRNQDQYLRQWQQKIKLMPVLDIPTINGGASEAGIIKFFEPIESIEITRARFKSIQSKQKRQYRLLFNSSNKFAYVICENNKKQQNSQLCLYTQGAPQKVWKMCKKMIVNGQAVPITAELQKKFKEANFYFGNNGERVLGCAKLHLNKQKFPKDYQFNIDDPNKANFPLFQQVFIGMISLNDPPRDAVPFSVTKCQAAGVKVIMVTGDQPLTATSIARKCNIIRSEETVNEIADRLGITFDEAFSKSDSIVIHGDLITAMSLQDEGKPENEQGKKMQRWLSKPEIVFARTSPAQKLIIVKACQRLGHIVAVTGDGVNDSPAIKKADLGISMGITGTDVAKDAADMILLTDDFSAIVLGMEEGRRIFDNLKKAIVYVMTSQVSEIAPFLGLLIIQFPPPITTVILLCIDLGTDLIPAVSFAYEPSELGIMTRKPRNSQQHLVTIQLMGQGYGWAGWMSFWTSLISFYIVMNDFGFNADDLYFKNTIDVLEVGSQDVYNASDQFFGNSILRKKKQDLILNGKALTCGNLLDVKKESIDWIFGKRSDVDLRVGALKCDDSTGTPIFTQIFRFQECKVQQISPITNKPVCFTVQAAKYGQSSYFYSNVITQIFSVFNTKTRKESIFTQGLGNLITYFGITIQCIVTFLLAYTIPLNIVFGTRDNIYIHFGINALPLCILYVALDESRKYCIRNLPPDAKGKPNWFHRLTLW